MRIKLIKPWLEDSDTIDELKKLTESTQTYHLDWKRYIDLVEDCRPLQPCMKNEPPVVATSIQCATTQRLNKFDEYWRGKQWLCLGWRSSAPAKGKHKENNLKLIRYNFKLGGEYVISYQNLRSVSLNRRDWDCRWSQYLLVIHTFSGYSRTTLVN